MLLFGGESSEHTVSISSARNVFAALDDIKFNVVPTYIDEGGKWWQIDNITDQIDTTEAKQLLPVLGSGSFMAVPGSEIISPNVILPILHGLNGEDGTVQGLARLSHIPIVGCGIAASAIAIDKVLTKQLLENSGITIVPYEIHLASERIPSFAELSEKLGDILFVKPATSGSSVGISKAKNDDELKAALSLAHQHSPKVLIEKAIDARELEVGILGNGAKARTSCVGEINADRDFYDFDSKYSSSSQSKVMIPADITLELSERIRKIAVKAFAIIDGEGLARVDFFLSSDGILYLNEINTMPGFTNISMYPKLWRDQGMTYPELIEKLIALAI